MYAGMRPEKPTTTPFVVAAATSRMAVMQFV